MNSNGRAHAINSFEDVEEAIHDVKTSHADFAGEVSAHFGKIARDLSALTRGQDEIRRLLIERTVPARGAMDTGSFFVEAVNEVRAAAADPTHPLTPSRARALFAEEMTKLKVAASASRWDRLVALLPYIGRESLKVVVSVVVTATLAYLWYIIHK